MLYFANLSN